MPDLQIIADLITSNRLSEAMSRLNSLLREHPENDEALFMRGKISWRMGDRIAAMNDYAAAAAVNPDSPATAALQNARDVNDFFNPDIFNP